jgi:response regulator RpfG family c-di-GMP phosphodiesterase
MKISKKSLLIELLSGTQVVTLTFALIASALWIRSSVQGIVREQIGSDNRLIASQMARLISLSKFDSIDYGTPGWDRLQTLIEEIELPNDGYMCIAGAGDGKLVCHPEMRERPGLRGSNVGQAKIQVGDRNMTVMESTSSGSSVTGTMESLEGTEVVSAAMLPEVNGILLVHQSDSASEKAVNDLLIPIGAVGLAVGLGLILVTRRVSVAILVRYENKIAEINEGLEETVRQRTRALTRTRDAVIFGLAKLSESRDNDTGEHLDRIRTYSTILAQSLASRRKDIDGELVANIGLASSLHDIGKVGVPDCVLLKPGRLTVEERRVIEVHPQVGRECLEAVGEQLGEDNFLKLATEICAFHHEKWDGTGYPNRLAGTDIPISARIVALADVYDALRSRRPYKDPMSHEKACSIILEGRGTHFDPDVVDAFFDNEKQFRDFSDKLEQVHTAKLSHYIAATDAETIPYTV